MSKSDRDNLLREFRKEAKGSFSAVYKALTEESVKRQSSSLQKDDVKNRIKTIIHDGPFAKAG
ncbi:hypothetical protein [Roseibium sp.]|uniref:hypothetical protein n=1 Tax=Roseibium sp. TaxID=1936156 RepID=UPI003A984D94